MKVFWVSGGIPQALFTSALDGREWLASRPGCFIPGETTPRTQRVGCCPGPRAGLDAVVKREIPSPCRDSNPDHPARSP
jgi:hypothetical protein